MPLEDVVRWLAASLAWGGWAVVLIGLARGLRRPTGTTSGRTSWLHSAWYFGLTTVVFLAVCWAGWIPLPVRVGAAARGALLAAGSLLYFPGLILVLWGRFALGRSYFASTAFGARLFADHRLVTAGPYAFVRHPMYVGLILAAWGSVPIFATWTTLAFALGAPALVFRARREEKVLAAAFGEQWTDYCRRVPAFLPRLRR